MKPSLEDERRALLEHIEASRAVYRRMLSESTPMPIERHLLHQGKASRQAEVSASRRVMQWMIAHPLWVAGGVALIVLLTPRLIDTEKRAIRKPSRTQREPIPQGGTLRALMTVAAIVLRDPSRIRSATQMMQSVWHWMRRRQSAGALPDTAFKVTARADKLH